MTQAASCPKCGSSVEGGAGFGMVECAKCGEFIMLGAEAPVLPESDSGEKAVEFEFNIGQEAGDGAPAGLSMSPPVSDSPKTTVLDINYDQINKTQVIPSAPAKPAGPLPSMAAGSAMGVDFGSPVEALMQEPLSPMIPEVSAGEPLEEFVEIKPQKPEPPPRVVSPQFADVVSFGNEVQASSGTGGLVYDIYISGVDTVDSRKELAHYLDDKRLQLSSSQILSSVKAGELEISNLNPVKASVLISSIKHLPFKIRWTSKQLIKGVLIFFILGSFLHGATGSASEWGRHEVNLKGYATRIQNMQDDLHQLIVKKNKAKDPKERDEILKDIIKKNVELHKTYDDFKKEKEHVRFEHPEQGDNTERKYRHVKLKSLDELEDEVGLDGQLSRLKKKVENTYPSANASPSLKEK